MRTTAAVFIVACSLTTCAVAGSSPSEQMISVGSHRLQMRSAGEGTPVVVIDAGLADTMDKFQALQDTLARVTRVITYNRAGYGQSEPGPTPRDAGPEADDLYALLEAASVTGPYVLVGHSLGALNVEMFASRYPKETAGIILMDPPPLPFIRGQKFEDFRKTGEQMTAQWQAIADSADASDDPQQKAKGAFFGMIASEHREMFGQTAKEIAAISTFGDIPLVVIASGKPNPAMGDQAGEFQKFWVEQSRALAGKSAHGKFVLAKESSHFLYLDVPDIVAQNILALVKEARAK